MLSFNVYYIFRLATCSISSWNLSCSLFMFACYNLVSGLYLARCCSLVYPWGLTLANSWKGKSNPLPSNSISSLPCQTICMCKKLVMSKIRIPPLVNFTTTHNKGVWKNFRLWNLKFWDNFQQISENRLISGVPSNEVPWRVTSSKVAQQPEVNKFFPYLLPAELPQFVLPCSIVISEKFSCL